MKHIETSVSFVTQDKLETSTVKYSFVQRLRNAFHVETVGEGTENFAVSATSKATSYFFTLNVMIRNDHGRMRLVVDGGNEISLATRIFYVLSLLAVLALSFFPGSLDDSGAKGGIAIEAMFFLVVGGFIIYDINKKLDEPQQILDRILQSVNSEFS